MSSIIAPQDQLVDALSTEHLQADLKGRSVRGGLLTLTSQGSQFIIQSVSTVALARLLTPADFGLVAMVTAITALATGFADLGLSEATIQRHEITQDQVSSLFWINVAIGLALTIITAAMAPVLAWFYREPRLRDITLALSLTFILGGLKVQHDALLKRQMRFSALGIRDVASNAVAVIVSITMARVGAGYWALVAYPLSLNLTRTTLSWLMVRWTPSFFRSDAGAGSMIAFGGTVAASYLIYNFNRSADNVLIGWYWGAGPLGLYSRAYNLLMLSVRQLSAPVGNVLVPAFSRVQHEPERFARYYLRAVNLIMWMSAPIFGFLFVAAQPVIVLTLGAKWQEAAPVFQILAISAWGQLLLDTTVWSFVSRGQSARLLKLLLVISPITVASFAIGLPFGIKGVALTGSLVLLGIIPWTLRFAFRDTRLTLLRLGKALMYPISLCLAGVALAELGLHLLAPHNLVLQLLVVALGFTVSYSLSALLPSVRQEVMAFRTLFRESHPSGQAA